MWYLKKSDKNVSIYKTETDSQTLKKILRLPKEKGSGGGKPRSLGSTDAHYYI